MVTRVLKADSGNSRSRRSRPLLQGRADIVLKTAFSSASANTEFFKSKLPFRSGSSEPGMPVSDELRLQRMGRRL
jgi:hypothetical protein